MRYRITRRCKVHGPGDRWYFKKGQEIAADEYPQAVIDSLVVQGLAKPVREHKDKQEAN